jgi:hypothetical protein
MKKEWRVCGIEKNSEHIEILVSKNELKLRKYRRN